MKANQPDTNKQIAENLLVMIERLPIGFAHHEIICDSNGKPIDYRFLNVNSKFEFFTGLKASDLIGKTVLEVLPNTEQYWIDYYGKVALTQEPVEFENYSQELNKYYSVYAFSPKKGEFIVLFVDITNTKLVEENLKANQEKLNTIFDFAPVAIITLYNNRINYCNKVFLETYKYTDYQEIYDLTIDDIFDKKTHTLITQENQKSLTIEKYSNTIIGTGIRKDKTEFPVAINTILIKLKNNLLNIIYIQDITEQKNLETTLRYQAEVLSAQYEELQATTQELEASNQELENNHRLLQDINAQLKEREEQLNIALEGAELGFWIYDIDSGLLTCNLILYRILGYQPNEIEFNIYSLRDHIYQSDLKKFDQIWLLVAAGKKHHINLKLRFYNKFGDLKWLYIKARVIENNANGLPSKIAGIVYDITQEKLLHDKLQESEYKYRTIFNATHAYMFLIDANTLEIIDVNNSALIAYGYTLYELIGKNINILCAKSDDCVIKNAIDKKQNYIEFTVSYTKNKNPIEVEIELESLFIKQKKYYICSLYNISERLAAEKKIYQSEEQYRSLVNKLPVGVYRTTIDGKLLFGNQALLKILEIDNSVDLSSINTADFYLDKQKRTKEIFKILSVPLNKECVYNYELQLKTAKGNIIWVRDTSKAILTKMITFCTLKE